MPETPSTDRSGWRALLIGIDRYLHVPDLGGAVHDTERAYAFARTALGIPKHNVVRLTDARATRETIIRALWAMAEGPLGPDDQVLIHFSGHGARMRDPWGKSPDGYIECLVAHDSGPGGAWNIPDVTVGALLDRITRRTPHVTVVLDCCHSGSGTREPPPGVRLAEADEREPPTDLDAAIRAESSERIGDDMPYTALAACRDRELALEYIDRGGGDPIRFGLFSSYLYPAMERALPGTAYRSVIERVAARVTARARYQHPQCEGRGERVLFGGADVRRDPFHTVTAVIGDQVEIDGGALHGLRVGEPLALHPSTVETRSQLGEPMAYARIISTRAATARARLDAETPEGRPMALPDDRDLLHARLVRLRPITDAGRVRFEYSKGAPPVRLTDLERHEGLQWRLAEDGEDADIRVEVDSEYVHFLEPSGHRRLRRVRGSDRWMYDGLSMVARFDRLDRLRNTDAGSRLAGLCDLALRRIDDRGDPTGGPQIPIRGGRVVLPYDPDNPDVSYVIEVTNHSATDVFPHLLLLSNSMAVQRLYPSTTGRTAVPPGNAFFVGQATAKEQLQVYLPDTPHWWARSENTLLLVVAQKPLQIEVLQQDDIGGQPPKTKDYRCGPLEQLLIDAMQGSRMLRRRSPEDWGTARLAITVVRKPARVWLRPGGMRLPEGLEVRAEASGGRISAAEFDRHALFDPELPHPPSEALIHAGLRPICSPADGAGESPLVIRLEGPLAGAVHLRVHGEDEALAPVAFARRGFTAAGKTAGPGAVTIDPEAAGRPILLTRRI